MVSLSSCISNEANNSDPAVGYRLRKRSTETRNKMAKMARAIIEDEDEDYLSNSASPREAKQSRTHERVSATKRERERMHKLNHAYDKLRKAVPKLDAHSQNKNLSKIATLRLAIDYISMLTDLLQGNLDDISIRRVENSSDEASNSTDEDSTDILNELIDSVHELEEMGWFWGECFKTKCSFFIRLFSFLLLTKSVNQHVFGFPMKCCECKR